METPEPLPVTPPQLASVPETETPPAPVAGGGIGFSDDEFQKRVEIVMAAIEDPEKFRRCVAEIHTLMFMAEQGFRDMQQEMIAGGGPMAMFRKMFLGR